MLRKKAGAALAAVLMLTTLAAGSTQAAITKEPAQLATSSKTKITAWYAISGNSAEKFLEQVAAFNKSQTAFEVVPSFSGSYADTATKISAALMSKTEPEVALMAAGPLYTGAREDYTMTKLMEDKDFNVNDFFKGTLEYSMYQGKICAIPYGISTPVLYYNKNITDAAGLDLVKNPPVKWDDLFAMAKTAKEKGNKANSKDFWGFDTSDAAWLFKTMLNQNENTVVAVDSKNKTAPVFQEASGVEVGNWWKKTVDEGLMAPMQHTNAEKKFLSGNLAFISATSTRISTWSTADGIKLGAVEMPYFKKKSVALGGNMLVMFPKTARINDYSWEFLKYLSTAENQAFFALQTGYLPVRQSALELPVTKVAMSSNPLYKIAFNQMNYSWAYWNFNEMGTMDGILRTAIDEIESGKKKPDVALKDAATSLIKEIQ